jgi:hypothetical protein
MIMKLCRYLVIITIVVLGRAQTFAQHHIISYDLPKILLANGFSTTNRRVSELPNHEKNGVMLLADANDGIAWLNGVIFANGIIDLDIRGKDAEQKSFLGVAFHALTDTKTMDVIYFRPFNFRAADSVKRSHSVQYESPPQYLWPVLREKFNGKYEKGVNPVPDPNGWFHIHIKVVYPEIKVFVNGNATPSLIVKQLNDRKSGLLGLWTGNNSDGAFANLKVTFFD